MQFNFLKTFENPKMSNTTNFKCNNAHSGQVKA